MEGERQPGRTAGKAPIIVTMMIPVTARMTLLKSRSFRSATIEEGERCLPLSSTTGLQAPTGILIRMALDSSVTTTRPRRSAQRRRADLHLRVSTATTKLQVLDSTRKAPAPRGRRGR